MAGRRPSPRCSGSASSTPAAFDEIFGVDGDETGFATIGAGLLVFVVGVTVLGWVLPATRALTGVVVGVIGVVGYVGLMAAISLSGFFEAFIPFALDGSEPFTGNNDLDQDTYITLAYAAGLVLLWVLASVLTHHSGFRVLIVTMTAVILPLAVFNLGVDDPNWVSLGAAVLGAVVVLLVLASGRSNGAGGHRGKRVASDAPAPATPATPPGQHRHAPAHPRRPRPPRRTAPADEAKVEDPTPPDVPPTETIPTSTTAPGAPTASSDSHPRRRPPMPPTRRSTRPRRSRRVRPAEAPRTCRLDGARAGRWVEVSCATAPLRGTRTGSSLRA